MELYFTIALILIAIILFGFLWSKEKAESETIGNSLAEFRETIVLKDGDLTATRRRLPNQSPPRHKR